MNTAIQSGAMMIREGVVLPASTQIESLGYSNTWRSLVATDSFALLQKLSAGGLHLFFIAGELAIFQMGWGERAVRQGMKRILARGRRQNLNCMEITQITHARFLGLPYVVIRGHSFHIQSGVQLAGEAKRKSEQTDRDWASA